MRERRVFHDGQGGANADAVVRAQSRAGGGDPAFADDGPDGVLEKVMDDVGVLFPDHVLVALKDDPGGVFQSGRGRLADDDVAGLVLLVSQLVFPGLGDDVLAQGFFVAGTVRDLQDFVEMLPQMVGLEFG